MSKAEARDEFAKLAEKAGFDVKHSHNGLVAYFHHERNEGFQIIFDGEAFESATWHAPTKYVIVVDRRGPGEFGDRSGISLGSTTKRRAVGMGIVRPEMRTCTTGLEIGYMDLKRRIKNPNWRES